MADEKLSAFTEEQNLHKYALNGPRVRKKMYEPLSEHHETKAMVLSLKKRALLLKLFYQNSENACKALRKYRRQTSLTFSLAACSSYFLPFCFVEVL